MKWYEFIGTILVYGALTQFIIWIFDSVKITENIMDVLSFLLANIFSLLIILIFMVYDLQKDNKKIKNVLEEKGFLKEEDFIKLMKSKFKINEKNEKNNKIDIEERDTPNILNKKGWEIDARVLIGIAIIIILYLLWKAGKLYFFS